MRSTATSTRTSQQLRKRHGPKVAELAARVAEDSGRPLDFWAVAAVLESRGMRDVDAHELGFADVIELGRAVFEVAKWAPENKPGISKTRPSALKRSIRFVGAYLQGFAFTLPMLSQVVLLLALGVAIFASTSLSVGRATVIGVAALGSMVVAGGFIQAMARRQHYYLGQDEPRFTRLTATRFLVAAILFAGALSLLLAGVNVAAGLLPWPELFAWSVYFLLLCALWLTATVLYVLRREMVVFVAILGGGLLAYVAVSKWGQPAMVGHAAALGTASVLMTGWAQIELRLRERRRTPSGRAFLGRRITAVMSAPYFAWGLIYFSLIVTDRLIAWSSYEGGFKIQFFAVYELGIDWALLVLMIGIALIEGTVRRFSNRLKDLQERWELVRMPALDHRSPARWGLLLGITAAILAGCTAVTWFGLPELVQSSGAGNVELSAGSGSEAAGGTPMAAVAGAVKFADFFEQPLVLFVAAAGMIGYVMLVLGLLNATFLLRFSRPDLVLRAALPALAVDLVVGGVSRVVAGQAYAVYGLCAGAAVFMVITTVLAYRMMKQTSYYNFASF